MPATRSSRKISNVEKEMKRSPCPIPGCSKSFTRKAEITRHLRTHTGERPFKCEQCESAFSQANALTIHYNTHTGDKPYKCRKQPGCPKRFGDPSSLSRHEKEGHGPQKVYKCYAPGCPTKLKRADQFRKHLKDYHGFDVNEEGFSIEKYRIDAPPAGVIQDLDEACAQQTTSSRCEAYKFSEFTFDPSHPGSRPPRSVMANPSDYPLFPQQSGFISPTDYRSIARLGTQWPYPYYSRLQVPQHSDEQGALQFDQANSLSYGLNQPSTVGSVIGNNPRLAAQMQQRSHSSTGLPNHFQFPQHFPPYQQIYSTGECMFGNQSTPSLLPSMVNGPSRPWLQPSNNPLQASSPSAYSSPSSCSSPYSSRDQSPSSPADVYPEDSKCTITPHAIDPSLKTLGNEVIDLDNIDWSAFSFINQPSSQVKVEPDTEPTPLFDF